MELRQEFRAAAADKGLPDEAIEWWLRLARPRFEMSRTGDGPVAGRFGGRPALPEGVEWPRGTACVATVDLAAIPAESHDLNLPPDGGLVFFAEPEIVPERCAVVYVPAGVPVVERDVPEGMYAPVYDPLPLHGRAGWSLPVERSESAIDLGPQVHDEELIAEVVIGLGSDDDLQLVIGGYADESTSGVGNPVDAPTEESLLAQLYLTDDLVGHDFGGSPLCLVSFVMTHTDLAAGRFDQARFFSDFNG
ncbi:DUF1963 domain-containing protein [Actinoallomurus rhizosphaericola]|uniref:DUF1963 domain-containing protein n=1 Tax=Actinoallomurus rhizosphaericola TaxID=2952536 RepID=UPI002092033B|nr:DUF1963 domain-containing protein [Actinoallomurus rhizosphaericola]MCO5999027.1 YwqG family protein [Actinoallomurus rhizosphaericola]